MQGRDLDEREAQFGLDHNVNVMVTGPMKQAIEIMAKMLHVSISDVVRQTLAEYLPYKYPQYADIHKRIMGGTYEQPQPKI